MATERRALASGGRLDRRPGQPLRPGRRYLRKVFPDHWSFMLGEIALWSFVVLLITGVFLSLWFTPSMSEVKYQGSYARCAACRCRTPTPRRCTSPSTSAAGC